jgi:SET family sugar efflux transporter-like MFS transporter
MTISSEPPLPGLTAASLPVLPNAATARSALYTPAFLGLLATNFVLGLTSALIVPFGSMWATQEIGMSARGLGLFMTINSISAIAVSTVLARWSDSHIARRHLLLLGSSAGGLGNLAFAFVRDPLILTLIGSSLLAVATINFAQLFAHVREELGRTEHAGADVPFVMGVLRACYALAWTVGPLLGASIKSQFGYSGIFLAASASFVVFAAFVLAFVVKRPRAVEARPVARERPGWGLGQPVVLLYCVAFALMFSAFTLNTLNLPLFLTRELGATEQAVGVAFGISPLFEMLFMVWFGHLATQGHQLKVIRVGICAALFYFFALTQVSAPWQVYPMQILNAAAVAVTTSVVIPFFQDLLPRQAGAATSLYANALKVGGLIGFMGFGLLASRVGYGGLFLVCAGLSASTLAIVSFVRPQAK